MKQTFLQIEIFCQRLQKGEYDHPFDLAKGLENLADMAWDDIEAIYQSSLRIDP